MDNQFIIYEKVDHQARIILNRPEVLNALHEPALEELQRAWNDFNIDPEMWVAIVTGSGERSFCVGADLKYRVSSADENALRHPSQHPQYGPIECYKPIIAAVNGFALGGGLELALGCDVIIASEKALFGLPEARRGLLADGGGALSLPRRIPYHLAMGMILTGRLFSAQEAFRMGLVNQLTSPDDLLASAMAWANEILKCSPLATQAAKQVILNAASNPDFSPKLIEDLPMVCQLRSSHDYSEGPAAFSQKREPVWTGR